MTLAMTADQNVIFLRPTPEEKTVISAAAARVKLSLNTYVIEAAIEKARHDLNGLPEGFLPATLLSKCQHCGRTLTRGNKSGFCRNCQRSVGLPTLRKLQNKESGHGHPVSPPTRRSAKRK